MARIPLKKPGFRVDFVNEKFALGQVLTTGAAFSKGDIVARDAATGKWELADVDHDVAATTKLAVALDARYYDFYHRPLNSANTVKQGGNKKEQVNLLLLEGLEVELNVNASANIAEANIGASFGLLFVAAGAEAKDADNVLTVDLTDTVNTHFTITGLADPIMGGTYGDVQARVRGFFGSTRRYNPAS